MNDYTFLCTDCLSEITKKYMQFETKSQITKKYTSNEKLNITSNRVQAYPKPEIRRDFGGICGLIIVNQEQEK